MKYIRKEIIKNCLIIAIIVFFIGANVIPANGFVKSKESSTIYFEVYIPNHLSNEFVLNIPNIEFDTISIEDELFTIVTMSGLGYSTTIGEAQLPIGRHMFEIPQGSNPEISVTSVTWDYISLNELDLPLRIKPVQPSLSDSC